MASITQVNTILNQIVSEDLTADGVASASRNLDAMQAKGDDVAEAMTGMGDAARSATTAVADAADKAATVLDRTAQKGVSSLTSLRRELSSLRAEEKALQESLDQGLSSGTDTSDTTARLSEVQAAMKATRQNIADLTREQKTAADAQAAWNGTLGEGNAATIGMRDALLSFDQTQKGVSSGLQAGMTGSLKTFLQMSSAAGDEVAKLTLQLQKEEDRLQQMRAQAASAVADGLSQTDAQAGVSTQQAKVDTASQRLSEARRIRDALDQEAEGHKNNASAAKLESYQLTILMDEAHKFLDMVMSGGNPLKAAFYEVPNAVGVLGGFRKAVDLAGGAMTVGLVGGALAAGAAIYEMGSMAEEEQSRLAKLSTQLKATRDDAQHMAGAITSASESLKAMPGWDESSARTAATTIGSTYNFSGSSTDISTLAGIARDAGSLFGSLEDGLKAVQTAMVDPTAEIEALYKQHLPGVDAALVEQVKTLQASGQQGEAYALVISKIRDASKDAYDQGLTPFQRSLENLEKAAAPVTHAISDLVTGMGARLLEWLTDLINLIPKTGKVSTDGLAGSTVLDDYAGGNHHYGLGQVDPRYASGYDISTPQGNIDAAIKIFMEANTRAKGNWDNTLAYYSGNKVGSDGQKSYNSAVYGYDINTLPSDTSSLIDTESSRLGLSSRLVNLFKGVIGHESGGHQYVDHAGATAGSAEAVQHATSAGVIDNGRSIAAGASDAAGGYSASSWSEQRAGIQAYIEAQQKLLAQQDVGSQKWKETQESITAAKVALANTLSPQEKITQGLTDSLDPLRAQTGYWRSMAEVVAQFDQTTRGTGTDQQALSAAMTAKQKQLAAAYDDGTVSAERQARSQAAIADAAGGSAVALQHATNYQQAYTEAQNDFSETSPEFASAVAKRTAALDEASAAQMKAQQLQQNAGLSDNLEMIEAQTASIGQNAQARQVNLAVMQAELEMHRKYGDVLPQEAQDYIALTGRVAEASATYQDQQAVLNEVTGDISSMADTLSGDFTQAFVNAANGGVTLKSALQGVESQVVSMIAKLALINPLLNAIDGGSRQTLSSISQYFSGAGGSGSVSEFGSDGMSGNPFEGAGTSIDSFSSADTGFGTEDLGANPFEGAGTSASAFSSGGSSLLSSGSSSWLSSGLKTNLFGTASVGSLLGGIGGGMGLGSALSSIGGGTYGTLGSGLGAAAGAVAGSFIPVIGTMLGGVIGGGLGGLLGGLFSKTHYVYDSVVGSDGQLSIGSTRTKHASDDVTAKLQDQLDDLNGTYSDLGISVNDGSYGEVGHYHKGKKKSTKTLAELLGNIDLSSDDDTFNKALQGGMPSSFDSVETYESTLSSLKQTADALDDLGVHVTKFDSATKVTVGHIDGYTGDLATMLSGLDGKSISTDALTSEISTLKSLLDITDSGSESLMSQVDDLKRSYQNAAREAEAYGMDAQILIDKGNIIAQQMIDAQTTKLAQADQVVQARYLTANGDDQGAALLNQQVSAAQEVQQLKDSWQAYLGDSYAQNETYQQQMTDLEKTQQAERLKIQQQYTDQAASSVSSVISSLTSYTQGLAFSDASPLSAQDQYAAANDNFTTDLAAAKSGDFTALQNLQGYASTLLSTSQTWNGSGQGYVTDYQRVMQALQDIGNTSSASLISSEMKTALKSQTDTLADLLQQLVALSSKNLSELKLTNLKSTTQKAA